MTELVTVSEAERKEIVEPASAIITLARGFKVVSAETYEEAASHLKRVKAAQKALEAKRATLEIPVKQALRAIKNLFSAPEAELETAEALFKRSMIGFQEAQEELRRAEQRKLDAAAETERRRLEAQARADAERAEAARAAGDIRKAETLEARADQRTDAAATVVPAISQREPPRVAGIVARENWYAVCTDLSALVKAIAEGKVPVSAVEPNMKVLNAQAKSLKKELTWPGVRAVKDNIIAAGSK